MGGIMLRGCEHARSTNLLLMKIKNYYKTEKIGGGWCHLSMGRGLPLPSRGVKISLLRGHIEQSGRSLM